MLEKVYILLVFARIDSSNPPGSCLVVGNVILYAEAVALVTATVIVLPATMLENVKIEEAETAL